VDVRTDIYALGVMLHWLLTGDYPFLAHTALEVELLHLEAPPPRPSAVAPVSPALDAVVLRCLEKDPARRFPDVAALLEAFRAAVGAAPATPRGRVIGLFVEVEVPDEIADEEFLRLQETIDAVATELAGAGFEIGFETSSAVLALRPLDALDEVRALEARLRARLPAARVAVHAGDRDEVLRVEAWSR
jgi:serine/threonine-protein kinase